MSTQALSAIPLPPRALVTRSILREALVDSVVKAKPSAAKGKYLKSVTVSSTMGPGVAIDTDGTLYGTASAGGNMNCYGGTGCGIVWMIKP